MLILGSIFFGCALGFSQDSKRLITAQDFFNVKTVTDLSISPDEKVNLTAKLPEDIAFNFSYD